MCVCVCVCVYDFDAFFMIFFLFQMCNHTQYWKYISRFPG